MIFGEYALALEKARSKPFSINMLSATTELQNCLNAYLRVVLDALGHFDMMNNLDKHGDSFLILSPYNTYNYPT
jgi:hypothetical protein